MISQKILVFSVITHPLLRIPSTFSSFVLETRPEKLDGVGGKGVQDVFWNLLTDGTEGALVL